MPTPPQLWESVTLLSTRPRLILQKDFGFLSAKQWRNFAEMLLADTRPGPPVRQRWIVYDSEGVERAWEKYTAQLTRTLIEEFGMDQATAIQLVRSRIECHVLPIYRGRIDWSLTVYEGQITLCTREEKLGDYRKSRLTISLDPQATAMLQVDLEALYTVTPTIDEIALIRQGSNPDLEQLNNIIAIHNGLKSTALRTLSNEWKLSAEISELALYSSNRIELWTLLGLIAAFLALVVYLHYL